MRRAIACCALSMALLAGIPAVASADDAVQDTKTEVVDIVGSGELAMHRLYNPNSGEHFYTADASERDAVQASGWSYEGVAWTAPEKSATPVYRLYNGNEPLGDHHYTTDKQEYDSLAAVGWTPEGVAWYSDDAEGVKLLRLYNPNAYPSGMSGAHHYTADLFETVSLVASGWGFEGVAWYGMAE